MTDIHAFVTTANEFQGYKVERNFGVVRGVTVRSRSVIGNMGAGIQAMFGGRISLYVELAEQTRKEAYEIMIEHAAEIGANAILAMRYDASEVSPGMTEVIAYGTAVWLVPA
ncbi:MAG TPA: YbjQ family protein [Fimbriimonadaceae bacterium]|nr:YbjQ family protein [Fimbriimonadaceae bacterium]